jgi:hypothetical protein
MREAGQGVSICRVGEGREGAVGYAGDDGIGGKHVDERQVDDGSDEDVAGEGNKVHGGTVEAAVGRGEVGVIRNGCKRGAKYVEGTRVRSGAGQRDEGAKECRVVGVGSARVGGL